MPAVTRRRREERDLTAASSIASLIAEGEARLARAGIVPARLEAEVLLARTLGTERARLLLEVDRQPGARVAEAFREDVERRASRYPLQYITGTQEFYSLEIAVDGRVLIPRPETEMIVDEVIRLARGSASRIVDVGTGSGCIAIAIARNLPTCRILATDVSGDALDVARANAARHDVQNRIDFAAGDGLDPAFAAGLTGSVDFVVSNPPYIAEAEMDGLQPELRHEPRIALTPGGDGLSVTRRITEDASRALRPGGWLLLELSIGRSEQVRRMLEGGPWSDVGIKPDLQGIPRLLTARR